MAGTLQVKCINQTTKTMNHNIDEIQLPSAKESADREELKFRSFVECWANMKDEDIKLYPLQMHQILVFRKQVSKRYLDSELKEKGVFKADLIYINNLIKHHLGLI